MTRNPLVVLFSANSRPTNYLRGLLVALDAESNYELISPVTSDGIDVEVMRRIPEGAKLWQLFSPRRIAAVAWVVRSSLRSPNTPSLFHVTSSHPWSIVGLLVAKALGVRTAVTRHDASLHPGEESRSVAVLLRLEARLADLIIAPSEAVGGRLIDEKPDRTVVVLAHPLARRTTAPLKQPDDRFELLFFGRIFAYKGVDLLVEAFAELADQWPKLRLKIVGEDRSDYLAGLTLHSQIEVVARWVSHEDMEYHFSGSGLAVLPYREASQSGVAMEAAALGIPVVATPVGGIREQVEHGVNGLLSQSVTSESFASAVDEVLKSPSLYERLVRGAQRTADRGGDAYLAFLRSLESY